jgi:hypothetical protein
LIYGAGAAGFAFEFMKVRCWVYEWSGSMGYEIGVDFVYENLCIGDELISLCSIFFCRFLLRSLAIIFGPLCL